MIPQPLLKVHDVGGAKGAAAAMAPQIYDQHLRGQRATFDCYVRIFLRDSSLRGQRANFDHPGPHLLAGPGTLRGQRAITSP